MQVRAVRELGSPQGFRSSTTLGASLRSFASRTAPSQSDEGFSTGWNDAKQRSGNADNAWSCETCRMTLRSFGTKVLRWNVAGGGFLSLIFNVGGPGTWNDRLPRPQLTDDLNDSTSASAVHMTVTNTWMKHTHTHTELEFHTVPVFWFNTILCDDNGKTIVQKLWVIEQMD